MKHPGSPHGAVLNECNSDIIFEASKRLDKMKIENQDVSIQIEKVWLAIFAPLGE